MSPSNINIDGADIFTFLKMLENGRVVIQKLFLKTENFHKELTAKSLGRRSGAFASDTAKHVMYDMSISLN